MKKTPLYSLMLLCLLLTTPGRAEVKLPAIVSSDMVLQRNTTITLWGWAEAGKKITIKASWLNTPLQITTDKSGNWKTEIRTTNDKSPQTIRITGDGSDISLENILFGEVWLCSGQSNMQQPLNGYTGQPTFGALEAISSSKNPNLRLFTVDRTGSKTPLKDVEKYTGWQAASPETVKDFSAIAYFYGQ